MNQARPAFAAPVRDSELPTLRKIITRASRMLGAMLAVAQLVTSFAMLALGDYDLHRVLEFSLVYQLAVWPLVALTYTDFGHKRAQQLCFLLILATSTLNLMYGYQSRSSTNHFVMLSIFAPVCLAAFVPWRPTFSLVVSALIAAGYVVAVELLPYRAALSPVIAVALSLNSGFWGAVACQAQRRRLADLSSQRQVAQAAALARSEFLANMSHEIRTPMTAILGFTEELMLEAERRGDEPENALQTIRRNGEQLVKIINDILDLSKIEVGRLRVECRACRPREVVESLLELMRRRAEAKGLHIELRVHDGVPEEIQSDPSRLRQILANLFDNAIKYTDSGGVSIGMRGEAGRLFVEVADTGMGMTPEQLDTIFQPFSQADASNGRRHGGAGLGLTLARALARLLGGELVAASVQGEGSVFRLAIPCAPVARSEPSRTAPTPERLSGRLLLAEDGADNQRLISALLERAGLEVALAENGREAVRLALGAREAGQPFDLILMDMQMPEMTGYQATRYLREADYTGPIIALTAQAMAGDREECLTAGCDEYTAKPIDRDHLLRLISQYLAKGQER